MRTTRSRLVTLATAIATALATSLAIALIVVLAGAPTPDSSAALVGLTVVLLAGVLGARYAAVALGAGHRAVGTRAQAHRQSLDRVPAPQHPRTAGRPSPRAPAGVVATA